MLEERTDRIGPGDSLSEADLEPSRPRFWGWAALVAVLVLVPAAAAAVVDPHTTARGTTFVVSMELACYVILLAAGIGLYLRWRIADEAPIGWLTAAAITLSVPHAVLAVIQLAAVPALELDQVAPLSRLLVAIPAMIMLARSVFAAETNRNLRPIRLGLTSGLLAGTLTMALTVGTSIGTMPSPAGWVGASIDGALAVLTFLIAFGFTRARSLYPPVSQWFGLIVGGLALGYALRALAREFWEPLWFAAAGATLAAVVLLALVAASLVKSALEVNRLRVQWLSVRANSIEQSVRRGQEQLHELRATVSDISKASTVLSGLGTEVDAAHKNRIEQMMTAELSRLERLLDQEDETPARSPVLLDDVIGPLVVCQRELGTPIQWEPTGTYALGRYDQIAEALHILLTNAHTHAAGAKVEIAVEDAHDVVRIVVRDDGPGVPEDKVDQIFHRGAKGRGSSGQGLGLYIARRLATEQSGTLELEPSPRGAQFVLTLPQASVYSTVPRQRGALEEAG